MDSRPIMSAVAATKLYNGGRIPWTDEHRPYRPFRAAAATDGDARVNANTSAYAAYLSCEVVRDYSMTLNRRPSTSGTITMTGKDRGCDFEQEFGVTSSQEMYFKTTTQLECSADAFLSRLVFTAGTFPTSSQNLLGNVSVISCATGYRSQPRVLTVFGAPASSSSSSTATTIHPFAPVGEAVRDRPVLWRTTTDFGSLVLYLAQKRAPAGFLGAEVLAQSISDIFTSVYMTVVAVNCMEKTSGDAATGGGAVSTPATRLFVVPRMAYVVAFLALALWFAFFVFVHARNTGAF
ncbi:hypothetical protein Cob_v002400 [Colletotrichum orbiculare MAFF 240422]|uniref:Uncharacterized protein n=1 Tax=Colletotrichum orbiculare (strain 104-T / ATCC 96160 / CBS 514.97 / LARS 414 / MAFF 240422) TaxID=1213857 RepID=A0A484G3N1_COLOR|nr:hypothetical protein Cob_v002400 [Colletotrichum orbiculare MAFF 240422]